MRINIRSLVAGFCLFSASVLASGGPQFSCADLEGRWTASTQSHPYVMTIYPANESSEDLGEVFWVEYNVSPEGNKNRFFCYEGEKGVKPLVVAFERVYGGHSAATYNDDLALLWAGVLAKDEEGQFIPRMDYFWFKKEV